MIETAQRDGRDVRVISRKTNDFIVTETRTAAPWRALPRAVKDRVVGLEASRVFLVRYLDHQGPMIVAVRCWKCGTPIQTYQPVLRPIAGAKQGQNSGELTLVRVNGREMVVGTLLPFNHYREGLFAYRMQMPGRRRYLSELAHFSFLHCADCHIGSEHGEELLACMLGQKDARRDLIKPYVEVASDDEWAQWMYHWSGIELVGITGPSIGPKDLLDPERKGAP